MQGQRLIQAKQAFRWWLGSVQPGNVWSVLRFDNGKGLVVVPFKTSGQGEVGTAIEGFAAIGNTPIVATLTVAQHQIAERRKTKPYERHVVLLFTDGDETQDKDRNRAVVRKINELRAETIEVVGIGYAGAGDYLARATSRYFSAADETRLKDGLAQVEVEVDPLTPVSVTPEELKKLAIPPAHPAAPNATKATAPSTRSDEKPATPISAAVPPVAASRAGFSVWPMFGLGLVIVLFVSVVKLLR
jgi:hypothetical protein